MGETMPMFNHMGGFDKLGIAQTGLRSLWLLFPGVPFWGKPHAPPWAYSWAPFLGPPLNSRGRQSALLGTERRMVSLAESASSTSAITPSDPEYQRNLINPLSDGALGGATNGTEILSVSGWIPTNNTLPGQFVKCFCGTCHLHMKPEYR